MSNEYKKLKEELDSVDLDSILPGFDREASWKELSPRLKKMENNSYAWRYAAALVALIIAAVLIRMQMNKQRSDEQVSAISPITAPATVDTNAVPVGARKESVSAPVQAIVVRKTKKQETPSPGLKKEEPQTKEELIANSKESLKKSELQQQVEQPVVTQTKPIIKRPKAIHLLDIDNENRQAAIQNPKELQGGLPQRIVNLIPGRPYSNTENDRKPSSLFRTN